MAKKKSTKPKTTAPDQASFEESLDSLHGVVEQLEDGQLSLSDSLSQYEQGVKHLKNCHAALKEAERKIELLVKIDKDGNLVTQDFDDAATEELGGRGQNTAKRTARKTSRKSAKPKHTSEEQELVDELEQETDVEDDPSSLF
jgi:exodeoxyribonuclease VII small subunit